MTSAPAGHGSSPETPTVTARGYAIVRAEPDEALLWVTLSALEPDSRAALADVAARSRSLISLLDELGLAAADRSTSGIAIHEEFDHTPDGRHLLGHRATAVTALRTADLDLIGQLIQRATDELAARINGPQWQIALENAARKEAARQAAADARRRAEAYAAGVGAALGRLLEISEPENPSIGTRAASGIRLASMGEPMPVDPGEQEVTAAVRVTFALDASDVVT